MTSVSWLCRLLSLLALGGGVILLLQQWVSWLQTESWRSVSALRMLYDAKLLTTQWYIYPGNTQIVHDFLAWLPASAGLIALAPLLWLLGSRLRP